MKRLWPMVLVASAVIAGATWFVFTNGSHTVPGEAVAGPPGSAPVYLPELTTSQARTLAADLTSGAQNRVRRAVAVSPGQDVDADAVTSLAALRPIAFDVTTFRRTGRGEALLSAHAGDGSAWVVHLVPVARQWKISTTEPLP